MIDSSALTVPVARLINQEVENSSLEKSKMGECFVKLAEAVADKKIKEEASIPTTNLDPVQSLSPPADISDEKKINPNAYSTSISLAESDTNRYGSRCRACSNRRHRTRCYHHSTTPPAHNQDNSKSSLKVLIPVNERY